MTHGSLFSGIGGFDLAAQWMGWENVFHCEWNDFGQKVLKYYWPDDISYGDITKTDFTIHRGRIDVLTGGFPCQPYSMAGKRLGKEDDRHLWPQMLRAIREIKPTWVVGENVFGIVSWNGGLVFDEVQTDLEAEGYEVQPYVLPACSVNAPHRRDRVWFVAHRQGFNGNTEGNGTAEVGEVFTKGTGHQESSDSIGVCPNVATDSKNNGGSFSELGEQGPGFKIQTRGDIDGYADLGVASDTHEIRLSGTGGSAELGRIGFSKSNPQNNGSTWDNFPTTQPTIRRGNDGLSFELAGITVSKHRNESIKAYGNAIVPQVVYQIFKAIEKFNTANL